MASNGSATYVKSDGDIIRAIVVSETDETSGEYEGWRCMTIYPNAPEAIFPLSFYLEALARHLR